MSGQLQQIAKQATSRIGQTASSFSAYKDIIDGVIPTSTDRGVRLVEKYDKFLVNDIYQSAIQKQNGVSLKYMLDFGQQQLEQQLLLQAQFLQKELPNRLAHRVAELENLPYGLSSKKQIITVRDWYVDSFQDIRQFPKIKTYEEERQFTNLLEKIYKRHAPVLITMAKGVAQLRKDLKIQNLDDFPQLHSFLDNFYLSRIGIRMLLGQHISLHQPQPEDYIGLINKKTSPVQIAEDAVADARDVCLQQYGEAPEVQIFGSEDLLFPYVPSHLHQMLFELVKNSIRAVHDKYEYSVEPQPPVRVIIAEGVEDITIKISDEGGGIPRSALHKIFTYLYTTAKIPYTELDKDDSQSSFESNQTIVAGYGFGLPISRLLARYFGGDLQVISMDGYGTDAYLHLNRLGNSQEPLP